jgi:hypothetical protein
LLLLGATLIVGCSGNSKLSVSGSVTLDGEPLSDGIITFTPLDGSGANAGTVIFNGEYQVEVMPGKKLARIEGYKTVAVKKVKMGSKEIDAPDKRPIVPKQYNSESKLEVDVDSSHREHNFELKGGLKVDKG